MSILKNLLLIVPLLIMMSCSTEQKREDAKEFIINNFDIISHKQEWGVPINISSDKIIFNGSEVRIEYLQKGIYEDDPTDKIAYSFDLKDVALNNIEILDPGYSVEIYGEQEKVFILSLGCLNNSPCVQGTFNQHTDKIKGKRAWVSISYDYEKLERLANAFKYLAKAAGAREENF